jgi:hypothetical protein
LRGRAFTRHSVEAGSSRHLIGMNLADAFRDNDAGLAHRCRWYISDESDLAVELDREASTLRSDTLDDAITQSEDGP